MCKRGGDAGKKKNQSRPRKSKQEKKKTKVSRYASERYKKARNGGGGVLDGMREKPGKIKEKGERMLIVVIATKDEKNCGIEAATQPARKRREHKSEGETAKKKEHKNGVSKKGY